jgi:hypothetical protein
MDHDAGPLHILLVEKEGRIWLNAIYLKLYRFERITWWCLSVLESIMDFVMKSRPTICPARKKISRKSHGSPMFAVGQPLGCGLNEIFKRPWNLIHNPPCRTPCRLFIHEFFLDLLDLHLRVWSGLGRSPPFRPTRALRWQRPWAFSRVCGVGLGRSPPFQPTRALRWQRSRAFSRVCEVDLDGLRPFDKRELLDDNGHGPSVVYVKWTWTVVSALSTNESS